MSNNVIEIIFKTLGLDILSKRTREAEEDIKSFKKEIESSGKSFNNLARGVSQISVSFKEMKADIASVQKSIDSNDEALKQNLINFNNLSIAIEEQKKARDEFINEVLSKEKSSIEDIVSINGKYINTLKNVQVSIEGIIEKSKEENSVQKSLVEAIVEAERSQKAFNDISKNGVVSIGDMKNALNGFGSVIENTLNSFKNLGKSIDFNMAISKTAISGIQSALSGIPVVGKAVSAAFGSIMASAAPILPVVLAIGAAVGGVLLVAKAIKSAYNNSKDFQSAVSSLKDAASTVFTPMLNVLTKIGDIIGNNIVKPLADMVKQAAAASGATKTAIDNVIDKEKEQADLLYENMLRSKRHNADFYAHKEDLAKANLEVEKEYSEKLIELYKDTYYKASKSVEDYSSTLAELQDEYYEAQNSLNNYDASTDEFGNTLYILQSRLENSKKALDNQTEAYRKALELQQESGAKIREETIKQRDLEKDGASKPSTGRGEKSLEEIIAEIQKKSDFEMEINQATYTDKLKLIEAQKSVEAKAKDETLAILMEYAEKAKLAGEDISQVYIKGIGNLKENIVKYSEEAKAAQNDLKDAVVASSLEELKKRADYQKRMNLELITDKKELEKQNKSIDDNANKETLSMLNKYAEEAILSGRKIEDIYIEGVGNLKEAIKKYSEEVVKETKTWQEEFEEAWSNISSIISGVMDIAKNFWTANLESLTEYDEAIKTAEDGAKKRLEDFDKEHKESNEEKKEIENTDREERIVNLQEEYDKSLEAGDQTSAKAIDIKLRQLQKEQQAEDKKRTEEDKKKNDDAKKDEERKRIEVEGEYNVAVATYNRDMAEYNNNIKAAEQEKSKAIADAALGITQSIANAAMMPLMPGWAALGPAGMISAGIAAGSSLGGALASLGNISSAASNLDSVKADAPTPPAPPKFAYGTSGYLLKQGERAIVGESGAEVVKNRGGDLEVISAERTKAMGSSGELGDVGGSVINIIMNVQELVSKDVLLEYIRNLKDRDFAYSLQ